jgi:phytoene dehydrogenase-like protein
MTSQQFDAIIIGSGMGGLTAAAFMAKGGMRPLVLEQHFAPGGNAQTFRRKRMFDFDVGLHYIGDCGPGGVFPTTLKQLGIADRVEFVPMDQDGFDTLFLPDMTFRMPAGWERYRQRLHEAFPQETRAIDRYINTLRSISGGLTGAPPSGDPPVTQLLDKHWSQSTLGELYDVLEVSSRLRHVLAAQCGLYGSPPSKAALGMHAMITDHYMRGAYFIRGGARPLVDGLVHAIEDGGGEVRLRQRVKRIIVENGKAVGVELAKGEEVRAPLVVSNADAKRTFLEMVGEQHLSPTLAQRIKDYSMTLPLFVIYMAMEVDPSELGFTATNLGLVPAYDMEEQYAACSDGRIPDEPATYISIASLKDPVSRNLAPPGYTNLQIMTLAPAELSHWGVSQSPASAPTKAAYRHTPAYEAAKHEMERRMLAVVEEKLPGFIRKVVWQECATPLTQERFTLSTGGTSYGFEHTPDQYMGMRAALQTELPGLWMVGANTIFGHGIAGTMMSGRAAAGAILQQAR